MLGNQKKVKEGVLGVSFIDNQVRWAHVVEDEGHYNVAAYGQIPIPDIAGNGEIHQKDVVRRIAQRLMPLRAYNRIPVVAAISEAVGIFFQTFLPSEVSPTDTIDMFIDRELEQRTASDPRAFMCEYDMITTDADTKILAVSAYPQPFLQALHSIFYRIGFDDIHVESALHALVRLHATDQDVRFFITHDQSVTHLSLAHGSAILDHRIISVGERMWTDVIKKSLNVDDEEAENIFRKYGLKQSHKEERVYTSIMKTLVPLQEAFREMKTMLVKGEKHLRIDPNNVKEVVCYGSATHTPGFMRAVETFTHLDVSPIDVWRRSLSPIQELPMIDGYEAPEFASALAVGTELLLENKSKGIL